MSHKIPDANGHEVSVLGVADLKRILGWLVGVMGAILLILGRVWVTDVQADIERTRQLDSLRAIVINERIDKYAAQVIETKKTLDSLIIVTGYTAQVIDEMRGRPQRRSSALSAPTYNPMVNRPADP